MSLVPLCWHCCIACSVVGQCRRERKFEHQNSKLLSCCDVRPAAGCMRCVLRVARCVVRGRVVRMSLHVLVRSECREAHATPAHTVAYYDYDYYGYGDYRGGYNEPFYRYDEFYFDYAGPPQPSAVRQPPNRAQPFEWIPDPALSRS
ncbi:Heterogeneous nuclear ribonucleoprotein Q [Operophtera brumata]|uniref:Heterogeneous nuclear ribonucleoprotein Q n=1 Tax=Operophtera brumata TaxID=104452 RepID=A0A0L7LQ87_OPEBR|nr:Heterogeneous nuclear ribonucleoprotein Q [Operophtera brumata]